MKYLVFSDVHGNLPALETVLKKESGIEGYINLGDVVNYGPWSNECVELISTLDNCYNIRGNHEFYFNLGVCDVKNNLVQSFFKQTFSKFKYKEIIEKYNSSYLFEGFNLIHTLGEKEYVFRDSNVDIQTNTMLGHSHQQYIRFIGDKLLVNPGSVGQNRKLINVSNYLIWDIETGEFCLKNVSFNLNHLLNQMKLEKYPIECIEYYKNKKKHHGF